MIATSKTKPSSKVPTAPAPTTNAGQDLAKKAVCLNIEFHLFGNTRKVSMEAIDVKDGEGEVDGLLKKSRLRASKSLLESEELADIKTFDHRIDKYIKNVCLPFDVGVHMVPYVMVATVEEKLKDYRAERLVLVEKFLAAYPERCEEAATDLCSQFRLTDYPPVEEVARRFGFSWRFISFGVPDQLKGVSPELWEQEREKAAQRMAEASAEIQLVLREAMAKLVAHMSDRLGMGPNGKPKVFFDTTISNLTDFLGTFDFRNVTDDAELQTIVAKARKLLQGVDTDALRKPGALRAQVQGAMQTLAGQLDTLVTKSAGGRKFRLNEQE